MISKINFVIVGVFGLETCLNVTPIMTDVILSQTVVAALTLSMDNKPCRFNFVSDCLPYLFGYKAGISLSRIATNN